MDSSSRLGVRPRQGRAARRLPRERAGNGLALQEKHEIRRPELIRRGFVCYENLGRMTTA